jgi:hypothetical protein
LWLRVVAGVEQLKMVVMLEAVVVVPEDLGLEQGFL